MGKKMTKAGAELRRAIRADIDAEPNIDHLKIRNKHGVGEAPELKAAKADPVKQEKFGADLKKD